MSRLEKVGAFHEVTVVQSNNLQKSLLFHRGSSLECLKYCSLEFAVANPMSSNVERPQKSRPPEIIKLNDAAKLAAQLMSQMTKTEWKEPANDNESTMFEPGNRPPRLGLGAKITHNIRNGPSNDPLDRKLYAKLDAVKKQAARKVSEDTPVLNNEDDDDNDDNDKESRTAIFDKKRAATRVSMTLLRAKKKRR